MIFTFLWKVRWFWRRVKQRLYELLDAVVGGAIIEMNQFCPNVYLKRCDYGTDI
jgi:hypothetical protein